MALSRLDAPARAPSAGLAWWSPHSWPRADRRAIALLVAVPVLVFVLPALAGHPAIDGDNLLQNFPLRVLTGRLLDAGRWPLWNVFSDSGTPLLGGMNAGSLYPGTLLFAVAPSILAWVANLLVVYWAAGIGLYVLARRLGAGATAAALAAITYAFSGAMVGQLVHVGVVQGQAWLPWIVLGQLALADALLGLEGPAPWRRAVRRAGPATVGLAAVLGLVCLTGEPRAIADAGVVVLVVGAVELVLHGAVARATGRGRTAYAVATTAAVAWGAALGFVQLAPGWGFISLTRRAHVTYAFFSTGAWPARWLPLLVVPGALGDNGVLATPRYFASYNLPEVTGAVGLAAATAVLAALVQCCWRRSPAPVRRLAVLLALCAVGVALATAPSTPLGPLLHHVPVLGSTRLQSRNIAVFDLGAAALLAWWLDAVLRGRREEASLEGPRRLVTLAPLALTAAVCAVALVDPSWLTEGVLGARGTAAAASGIRTVVAITLATALAYLAVLWRRPRRPAAASRALVAIVAVELVCFNVFFQSALVTGIGTVEPSARVAAAALGREGRTALVDPGVLAYHETAPLGLGNMSVFTRRPSVQGYGSLHAERYTDPTGTQRLGELDGCALARGAFDALRLASVAVAPTGFQASPASDRHPTTCGAVRRRAAETRYLGGEVEVARVVFLGPGSSPPAGAAAAVGLVGDDGRGLVAPVVVRHLGHAVLAVFPTHPRAVAVVLRAPGGVRVRSTEVSPASGAPLHLDTAMQVALDTPAWRFAGVRGTLSFFRATHILPRVWLERPASGARAHVVATGMDGAATVAVVSASAVRLVRSEAWLPGWGATLLGPGGSGARAVAVVPDGLVQSVVVPAGTWRVAFAYHAPHLRLGIAVSAIALLALVAALVALALARRRRPVAPGGVR